MGTGEMSETDSYASLADFLPRSAPLLTNCRLVRLNISAGVCVPYSGRQNP
jgi:hypothetical protein